MIYIYIIWDIYMCVDNAIYIMTYTWWYIERENNNDVYIYMMIWKLKKWSIYYELWWYIYNEI